MTSEAEAHTSIRAKVRLESVIPRKWGGVQAIFRCEYDDSIPEDVRFQKATPNGTVDLDIDNPEAIRRLVIGGSYYLDFTPAP